MTTICGVVKQTPPKGVRSAADVAGLPLPRRRRRYYILHEAPHARRQAGSGDGRR